MFEKLKLGLYFDKMIGFAYDFDMDNKSASYMLRLYMVLDDDGLYKFINYKNFKNYSYEELYKIADKYEAKPTNYYMSREIGKRLEKKL